MDLAPIVLFVYNRPWHTGEVLQALLKNDLANDSVLYIYADGPKENAIQEVVDNIKETRRVIKSKKWCREVIIKESIKNLGLAGSVVKGVTEVLEEHGRVIVLEDDILVSPYFLQYMNEGLKLYETEPNVISIHAYNYPVNSEGLPETFFMKGADCWGWATWAAKWQLLDMNAGELLKQVESLSLEYEFDIQGSYPYLQMLKKQRDKKISSWAICWYASAFLKNRYTLYPNRSLIYNIGFDKSGTHRADKDHFNNIDWNSDKPVRIDQSQPIESNKLALSRWQEYHKKNKTLISGRSLNKFRLLKLMGAKVYRRLFKNVIKKPTSTNSMWSGNYANWTIASDHCTGYDAGNILEKVKMSILKVKKGEASYERDSIAFDELEYSTDLLEILKDISWNNNSELNIFDFGGSLGSTYFQYRNLLPDSNLKWKVIEQPHYVDCGRKFVEDERLKFYYSIEDSISGEKSKVLFLGSVLQYLEKPKEFIREILEYGFEYIIIDRTGFIENDQDRLAVQNVPESIYKASYPVWFFNEESFLGLFLSQYDQVRTFSSEVSTPAVLEDGKRVFWNGYFLKRR